MSRRSNRSGRHLAVCVSLFLALSLFAAACMAQEDAETTGESRAETTAFDRVWNFELLRIGDRSLRVSQLAIAIAVLVFGLLISRLTTRAVRRSLAKRPRVSETAAVMVEKLLFYFLLVIVLVLAFQSLQLPIALFAFLGGALAIGLGFGAQNIIANFISGLILMFERPVRIGDLVEVDEHRGRIAEIRFRCTRIRRNDGVDVLVPNSLLLEKNVINWTLSDKQMRTSIKVGVIYGSPTDKVSELIEKAVREDDRVMKQPQPMLIFDDFGDNSLVFEIFFWTEVSTMMDLAKTRSAIRFRIDELFRAAGLVIAFPQRDVHLDTVAPLEVRLRSEESVRGQDKPVK